MNQSSTTWPNPRLGFFLVLGIALAVRCLGITSRPLWYDEAFAVLFAGKGLAAMLQGTLGPAAEGSRHAADIHPLLYYTLLGWWMEWFGSTPAAVRSLSILFGLAGAGLIYLLGWRMFGQKTGLLAGMLAAISPFQVHYAQEVRMYALMSACVLGAAYAMWQAIHTKKTTWWVLFAVLAALAQYSHSLASVHLVILAATPLLARRWKDAVKTLLAGAGALALYAPWLLNVPDQIARVRAGYWIEQPEFGRLLTALLSYVTNLPLPGVWLPVGLFISLFVTALAAWQTLRELSSLRGSAHKEDMPARGLWLFWLAFGPLAVLFILSQWQPVWIERALLPAGSFYLLWLSWAFTKTKMPRLIRLAGLGALVAGMLTGLVVHLTYAGFPYTHFAQAGEFLQARQLPGDLVLHSNKLSALPMVLAVPELSQGYLADPAGSGADTLAPATQRVLGLLAQPDPGTALRQAKRVWFVIFRQAEEEYLQEFGSQHPHLVWLQEHYRFQSRDDFGDLRVFLYAR